MMKFKDFVCKYKKQAIILGFLFIICLQCCVFPAVNRSYNTPYAIVFINFIAAIGICNYNTV